MSGTVVDSTDAALPGVMMAFLLFVPNPTHILIAGLGGGIVHLRELAFLNSGVRIILIDERPAEALRQADAAGGLYQLIVVPLLVQSQLRESVDRVLVEVPSSGTGTVRVGIPALRKYFWTSTSTAT